MVIIVQEKESLFEVDQVVLVLEIRKTLGALRGEVVYFGIGIVADGSATEVDREEVEKLFIIR